MGMLGILLVASLGCGPADPLAGLPTRPFDQPGAPQVTMALQPMQVRLAPTTTAPSSDSAFAVGPFETTGQKGLLHEAEWPFPPPRQARRAPAGITVQLGDRTLPWRAAFQGVDPTEGGWRVERGRFLVLLDHHPAADEIRIANPSLRAKLDRLDPERSGLTPDQYVQFEETRSGLTRNGLLVPPGATIAWDLDLPVGAVWRSWVASIDPPMGEHAERAPLTLAITDAGSTTQVSSDTAPAAPDDFKPLVADLSAWGGKHVKLTLTSPPGDHGLAFVGSPSVTGRPQSQPRRVIVIAVDTLRPDHLGWNGYHRATSPELDKLAAESATFTRAWSPAPRTRPSFRTATTGRWPLSAVGAKNIGEVFARNGFATAGIVANTHLNPRFGFDDGFDSWWLDGSAKADTEVDRAISWLDENRARDSYLFLHIMDPHVHYTAPAPFYDKFVDEVDPTLPRTWSRWEVYGWQRAGTLSSIRKRNMEALYDGEIAWTSQQIGRLIEHVKSIGDENTTIVFHTDHGEEFWEHNGYEHNHTLFDEVVRVALWIRPPHGIHGGRKIPNPASLTDIAPTLYAAAGFASPPQTDGIDLGPQLRGESAKPTERSLALGYLRYDRERWGVIYNNTKYVLFTSDAREELYDLQQDPKETKNLIKSVSEEQLWEWRRRLANIHDGLVVTPGYRIEVDAKNSDVPWTFTLPVAAVAAGVLDPESITKRPVNQEWGEQPPKWPADVGTVTLSDDKRTVTFVPGDDPTGILWVTFDKAVPIDVTAARGGTPVAATTSAGDGRVVFRVDGARAAFIAGPVIVPPPDEAILMSAIAAKKGAAAETDDLQMLKSLGYIGNEGH
jgi:arylsulfatase A-like enzyme